MFKKIYNSIKFVYNTINDDTSNRIIRELESERKSVREYLKHHDPYMTDYCTIRHERCNSCGLLVWQKDENHRYVSANDNHIKVFFDLKKEEKKRIIGFTDEELIIAWRKQTNLENTFGELCVSTDEYVKQSKVPTRFFEFGYKNKKPVLLDVFKSPILYNGEFKGTRGNAINLSNRESDVVNLLAEYIRANIARRLDDGKNENVAAYIIVDRRKQFNRKFPK